MLDLTKLASSFSYALPVSKLSVLLNLLPCSTPVVPLLLLNELEYGFSGNRECLAIDLIELYSWSVMYYLDSIFTLYLLTVSIIILRLMIRVVRQW